MQRRIYWSTMVGLFGAVLLPLLWLACNDPSSWKRGLCRVCVVASLFYFGWCHQILKRGGDDLLLLPPKIRHQRKKWRFKTAKNPVATVVPAEEVVSA